MFFMSLTFKTELVGTSPNRNKGRKLFLLLAPENTARLTKHKINDKKKTKN